MASASSSVLPSTVRTHIKKGLDSFLISGHSPKPLQIVYSTKPDWPYSSSSSSSSSAAAASSSNELDIAVLDSSFNPPHQAHLSLASSQPILARTKGAQGSSRRHYPAHLLLYSSSNADKPSDKPGDAKPLERLQMMYLLAKELEEKLSQEGIDQPSVAVGIVEPPLMKDKSRLIHQWFQQQHSTAMANDSSSTSLARPRLHWVVGWDTIIRFFALKYYPSPEDFSKACDIFFDEEQTTFVCARRDTGATDGSTGGEDQSSRKEEDDFLSSDLVRPWLEKGSVGIFDLPQEARAVSSTKVRRILMDKDFSTDEKRQKLVEEKLVSSTMARFLVEEEVYRP